MRSPMWGAGLKSEFPMSLTFALGRHHINPPIINYFTSNPGTIINPGDPSVISWSVTNADTKAGSIVISPDIGDVTLTPTGSATVFPLVTTQYTLTAYAARRISSQAFTAVVVPNQPPVINLFQVSPNQIAQGGSATLSWNVSGAKTSVGGIVITPTPGDVSNTPIGSVPVNPFSTTQYTLTATSSSGLQTSQVVTLTVNPPPTISLTLDSNTIPPGGSTTLRWTVLNSTSQTMSGGIFGAGTSVAATGSQLVSPPSTTIYLLQASGAGGSASQQVTLTVSSVTIDQIISNMQPGQWVNIANSTLRASGALPFKNTTYYDPTGNVNVEDLMLGWSGAAWDESRGELAVIGGGHGNNSDNSVYIYNLANNTWTRVVGPSDPKPTDGHDPSTPTSLSAQNSFTPTYDRHRTFAYANWPHWFATHQLQFWVSITGTFQGTVTLQKFSGGVWVDVQSWTQAQAPVGQYINVDNTVDYRLGFKTGNYTSGTAVCWIVAGNPTPTFINADGTPVSCHTYDGVERIAHLDKIIQVSGATYAGGTASPKSFLFDRTTNTWAVTGDFGPNDLSPFAAYDVATGHVFCGTGGSSIREYNPATGVWSDKCNDRPWLSTKVAAIDPDHHYFFLVGRGEVFGVNLDTPFPAPVEQLTVLGASEIISDPNPFVNYPGFEWDPIDKQFFVWAGGAMTSVVIPQTHVYTMKVNYSTNPKTATFALLPNATPTDTPGGASPNGVNGRFRYWAAKDVCVAVNDIDDNVALYKPFRVTTTIPITTQVWTGIKTLYTEFGYAGVKHLAAAHNPNNGKVYFGIGDHGGGALDNPVQAYDTFASDYRNEFYSLDVGVLYANRNNPSNPPTYQMGWTLETAYNAGSSVNQPEHWDFASLSWDSTHGWFWLIPGCAFFYDPAHTGKDTQAIWENGWNHIMSFDPVSRLWTSYGPLGTQDLNFVHAQGAGFVVNEDTQWSGVYDATSNTIVRFQRDPTPGTDHHMCARIYHPDTDTWEQSPNFQPPGQIEGLNPDGSFMWVDKGRPAHDAVNRVVYLIESDNGYFYKYDIALRTLSRLADPPGGKQFYDHANPDLQIPDDGSFNQPSICWDSKNHVVIFFRQPNQLFAYNPNTNTWSPPLPMGNDVPGTATHGNVITYDAKQNCIVLMQSLTTGDSVGGYAQNVGSGNGTNNPPLTSLNTKGSTIKPGSVTIWDSGTGQKVTDNGLGQFIGNGTGTIDYTTGAMNIVWTNPPTVNIQANGVGDISDTPAGGYITVAKDPTNLFSLSLLRQILLGKSYIWLYRYA